MKILDASASADSAAEAFDASMSDGPKSLWRLALAFLKIGSLGFGGGMAILPLVERDCVLRHHCIRAEEFLHGVGLGQILGPFAVNAAIFIGYRLFGVLGGLVAAVAFLAPSVLLVILLSWLYFSFHEIPSLQGALTGLGPVVIALIVSTAWSMGRRSLHTPIAAAIALVSCLLSLLRVNATWVLGGAALVGVVLKLSQPQAWQKQLPGGRGQSSAVMPLPFTEYLSTRAVDTVTAAGPAASLLGQASAGPVLFALAPLAWVFLKIGMVFFGGGFVLIPILYHKLVLSLGWMTEKEFLEGVAISQLTPGPVAVLATFAGYKVAGVAGALVATVALFTPATVLMFIISHFYQRLHQARPVQDLLAGITPTVVGMVGAAAIALAPGSLHLNKPCGWLLGALSFLLLVRWKWHPALVLLVGVVSGLLVPGLI